MAFTKVQNGICKSIILQDAIQIVQAYLFTNVRKLVMPRILQGNLEPLVDQLVMGLLYSFKNTPLGSYTMIH